ncbi:MAG TPA: Stk1 family PASTA domain-containing Ser/Thr kinase, partial [Rubrobacteraceae bacterium]|nr:Stk1 family PASTA domain-containing Ser/Thr kinase [Rubrobacteraceae bacterium]
MEQLVDNRYRIVRPLGAGGMAEVYMAHDDVLERNVALKVMSGRYADDEEFVERFRREAQSAAALSHPNIVSIYDRGESKDGTYYIAMEYLPGGTLKDRILKRGALPCRTAAAVALQIAEALQCAHEARVVHRDIKPHNVLVTESGDIKVGDFGIARAASSRTMTRTGSILGTAHYISPEQAMGEPVGPQSDLYSLGVVLYEMLTGDLPYDAETSIGIAMKHVNGHLAPPRELNPEIPEGINAITTRLLAKSIDERYASAEELIKDLERMLEGLEPAALSKARAMKRATPAGVAQTNVMRDAPTLKRARRQRRPWVPILLVLLLLLALIGGLAYAAIPVLVAERIEVPNLVGYSSVEEAEAAVGDDFVVQVEDDSVRSREPVGTIVDQRPRAGDERTARQGTPIYVDIAGTQVVGLPDVVGVARDEAVATLEEEGFTVQELTRESEAENEDYVIEQDPRGGDDETAAVESTVTITVGVGPDAVEVPNLYNLTPERAREALEEVNLELGDQTRTPSSAVTAGQIISQNPTAATEAEEGSSVDVTVSSGPRQIQVPNVVGSYIDAAIQNIWNAGFGYSVETTQSPRPAGTVISTDPAGGTSLDPNSRRVT